ncbi:hypothetical protein Rhe02_00180 [Rhizocola hellebori]|uniref:Uncharacterized protein n=1 Tax=Rhizocola hellebori TaxID=1392758 RepID=A0A8J3Q1M0_9ACTN|nr:hypothetical protein [Rhizocola hellebori]GIH01951.1 hypothetical protein Rhe02_00180 [Rhizocola hellebori]
MGEQPKVSRRAILRAGALAGAVGLVLGLEDAQTVLPWDAEPVAGNPKLTVRPTPTFTKAIYRRADQLSVRLEFYNLKLLKKGQSGPGDGQTARLVKVDPAIDAFIVVDFGPQHLAEHAYQETPPEPVTAAPIASMLAGASRLAFKAPATPILYSFGTLMAWKDFQPSLVPHAIGNATVRAPLPTETSIEVPWKVVLSPGQTAGWSHAMEVTTGSADRHPLWHARLDNDAKVRVVWTPDPDVPNAIDPTPPGVTSLTPVERNKLVKLTARWDQSSGGQNYVPQPVDVDQLALSSLGAWLKASKIWNVRPDGVDLKQWVHLATMGRDHFVMTVDAGRLWGIGHRVDLIKISERKFEIVNGKPMAVLRQRKFIVPRERVRTYQDGDIPFAPNGLRDLPFKKIRVLTPVTPNLAPYEAGAEPETKVPYPDNSGYFGKEAFWPRVGAPSNWADFLWDLEAEDYEGRKTRFQMPLIYVSETFGASPTVDYLKDYYESDPLQARRQADLGGQRVALAKFGGGKPGETTYPLTVFEFGVNVFEAAVPLPGQHAPWDFTPYLKAASARLDAVDRIRGGAAGSPQEIKLHPQWISDGDSGAVNPGRVFAALKTPVSLSYAANASGGVATPNMAISALSASTGPIDAPNIGTIVPTKFKPLDFFDVTSAKVLGSISLTDILAEVDFPGPGAMSTAALSPIPRLVTTQEPDGPHTALVWETGVVSIPDLFLDNKNGTPAKLMLRAEAGQVAGELTNFTVAAVGPLKVMNILFDKFGFVSKPGSKPDIQVSIDDVVFVGALEFVNVLRKFMGGSGAQGLSISEAPANGGYVNVSPSGVAAGYNLTLPPVPCGVLLLENISFGARVDLFFDGRPMRMRFNFADRNRPFVLTVMCFGGGGSVAVTLGLDDFELFEMTLEFGAKLALDIGVASGSISAMAGIYLAIGDNDGDGNDDGARLTGYLRLNGELDILGIVSMAIEFYLAFTYIESPESCYGEAKVTVEIEVLFFSASVTLGPIKKTFAGGGDNQGMALMSSTPKTFAEMTSLTQWAQYADLYDTAAF